VSRRRGRPRADRLVLLERVVELLRDEPELAAHPGELRARLSARGDDVRRVVRALRRLNGVELPAARPGRPENPLPNPQGGS
jgi:hypothetical protein